MLNNVCCFPDCLLLPSRCGHIQLKLIFFHQSFQEKYGKDTPVKFILHYTTTSPVKKQTIIGGD